MCVKSVCVKERTAKETRHQRKTETSKLGLKIGMSGNREKRRANGRSEK